MRTVIYLLLVIVGLLGANKVAGQEVIPNQSMIMKQLKWQFDDLGDVDYYYVDGSLSDNHFTMFVDANPLKGWTHDCYIASVTLGEHPGSVKSVIKIKLTMPPAGKTLIPIDVKNRYNDSIISSPQMYSSAPLFASNPVANRTYAIIVSGGVSKEINHQRYWNDCSFLFQTLVKKYGIPKGNIFPLISDGTNNDMDMIGLDGVYKTQSLDLDYDGVSDIQLSATKGNIQSVINEIVNKIQKDDHLLFFVTDHGGIDSKNMKSYICLWNNEKLYDDELASMLRQFSDRNVNVSIVLGQCYSGGFIDDLKNIKCVVATSADSEQLSSGDNLIPYDKFVYNWTSAINGATHNGVPVLADIDGDGYVSMKEAFEYAKKVLRLMMKHHSIILILQ